MYNTVIFDLDGTLLDTLTDLYNAVNYALAKNNYPKRTIDEVRSFVGNGIRNLIKKAMPEDLEEIAIDNCLVDFREYYSEHMYDNTRPYEGIMDLLIGLKERNIKLAIVSNKADFAVKELLNRFFANVIDVGIGEQPGLGLKPNPDTVFKALSELNVTTENACYVGDSEVDLLTGKNAKLPVISVSWGFKDRSFLECNGADIIAESVIELENMLK